MQTTAHPEVLASDWVPPLAIGRNAEVAEVVRRLDPPRPSAPPPWVVAVAGPPGAGTSTVARIAAREVADRLRAALPGPSPRVLAVRTGTLRGSHGVASALLRRLDDGFDGRGFPVAEILAGFLRRLRREGRPTVLVLDDVGVGGPDLGPLLRAIGNPDRFLPEGEVGLPPLWTILAGSPDALHSVSVAVNARCPFGPFVGLRPYDERLLGSIVHDRVARALGAGVNEGLQRSIVARALEDGGGATRALDLLRRRIVGTPLRTRDVPGPLRALGVSVEPHVLRAIEAASGGHSASLGEVRRCEAELARARGGRPLPATTLWRRIVRLERAGYVRREIRPGGIGGTRSIVRILAPVDEWVTTPNRPDSPRDVAPRATWGELDPPGEGLAGERSGSLWRGPDDPAD